MPMVFGNPNNEFGTGVAFYRDPATGEKKLMGEFPYQCTGRGRCCRCSYTNANRSDGAGVPRCYAEFIKVCETLENHYHDMQDMEFMVENKKLTCFSVEMVREQLRQLFSDRL